MVDQPRDHIGEIDAALQGVEELRGTMSFDCGNERDVAEEKVNKALLALRNTHPDDWFSRLPDDMVTKLDDYGFINKENRQITDPSAGQPTGFAGRPAPRGHRGRGA